MMIVISQASHLICLCSVAEVIERYLGLYTKETPRWRNAAQLVATYNWTELVENSAMEYLLRKGVSRRFVAEFVEGATRVNYGQVSLWLHRAEFISDMVIRTLTLFTHSEASLLLLLTMLLGLKEVIVLFLISS